MTYRGTCLGPRRPNRRSCRERHGEAGRLVLAKPLVPASREEFDGAPKCIPPESGHCAFGLGIRTWRSALAENTCTHGAAIFLRRVKAQNFSPFMKPNCFHKNRALRPREPNITPSRSVASSLVLILIPRGLPSRLCQSRFTTGDFYACLIRFMAAAKLHSFITPI